MGSARPRGGESAGFLVGGGRVERARGAKPSRNGRERPLIPAPMWAWGRVVLAAGLFAK